MVPASVKFWLVCVMLVPGLMVLFVANVAQLPELLLLQVAVSVSPASASLQITYKSGIGHIFVLVLVGASPFCVGAWFGSSMVVKL